MVAITTVASCVTIAGGVVGILGTAASAMPEVIKTAKEAKGFIKDDTQKEMTSQSKSPEAMKKMSETAAHEAAKEKGMDPSKMAEKIPVLGQLAK